MAPAPSSPAASTEFHRCPELLDQEALSELSGISRTVIYKIEPEARVLAVRTHAKGAPS
jgi:hypothetical protein